MARSNEQIHQVILSVLNYGLVCVVFLLRVLLLLLVAPCFSLLHGVGWRISGVEGADTDLQEGALDGKAGSSLQGGALVCKAGSSWDVVEVVVSAEGVV